MRKELREYQFSLAKIGVEVMTKTGIIYYAIEMRVGKTLIALETARRHFARRVLFVTKKRAITSIQKDYSDTGGKEWYKFTLHVTNYEQIASLRDEYDLVIVDEAHSLGAFPKPSKRATNLKRLVGAKPLILLSGTPSPESHSQIYHQLWISSNSPFKQYANFYKFAAEYVSVVEKQYNGIRIKDYSRANSSKVMSVIEPLMVTYTQKQADFESANIIDHVHSVHMLPATMGYIRELIDARVIQIGGCDVVAESSVKLQNKVHQLCSGTVIDEDGRGLVLDTAKANYIAREFEGQKIAIFYQFQAEKSLIQSVIKNTTDSPDVFNESDNCVYLAQIQSSSQGVDLSSADALVFYNINFSAVHYIQARARLQTLDRTKECHVHWIFAAGGIEHKVLKCVQNKMDYTARYFMESYANRVSPTNEYSQLVETE